MRIDVLGPGCPKCAALANTVREAVNALGLECELNKVTDITEITKYGVMMTPALVVDGEVKAAGKALSVEDVKKLLS